MWSSSSNCGARCTVVDFVFKLHLESGETYFRHLEFQSEADPEMAERCFRYNIR